MVSFIFTERSDRLKIIESKKEEAEYWITNYWFDDNIYDKNFFDKYEIVNEVLVDGNKINSLFKRRIKLTVFLI